MITMLLYSIKQWRQSGVKYCIFILGNKFFTTSGLQKCGKKKCWNWNQPSLCTATKRLKGHISAQNSTFWRPGYLNLARRSASMMAAWCWSRARTDMMGWPMCTLATVPCGLPNAPLIPVWSLQWQPCIIHCNYYSATCKMRSTTYT